MESEKLAQEHRLELEHLYDTAPVGLCFVDTDLRYVHVNKRLAAINGKPISEHFGRTLREVIPEIAPTIEPLYRQVIETGESILGIEVRGTTPAWKGIGLVSYYPVKSNEGTVRGVSTVVQDITDRKQAEEDLRRQKEVLQTIFDHIPVMVTFYDPTGKIQTVNRHLESVLGWSLEEWQNQDILALCYPDPDYRQEAINYMLAERPGWRDFETKVRDGGKIFTSWANVRLSNGTSIGIGQDITERKRAEEALQKAHDELEVRVRERTADLQAANEQLQREIAGRRRVENALRQSEARYRGLFQDSPISLWEADSSALRAYFDRLRDSGITELRSYFESHPEAVRSCARMVQIVDVNREALTTFGAREKQELIQDWTRILGDESYDAFRDGLIELAEGKSAFALETTALTLAGGRLHVLVTLSVVPGHEETLSRLVFSLIDITERKRAEEERKRIEAQTQHAQKLESLGALAGGIAHDFNNLLTSIIGFAELLKADMPEGTQERSHLEEVLKASERARDLVQQILTFSRRAEGRKRPIAITTIVKESLNLLGGSIPSSIEVHQSIDKACGSVLADATQIHQVVMNLCTNAFQAMSGDGGLLKVNLSPLDVDAQMARQHADLREGPYVRLTVSDTGPGIDPSVGSRIFDPFFTTKGVGEGTGLGLSVVHGIVTGHGGVITYHSEPGEGTSFLVYFPRLELNEEPPAL
jgi:PAS domain S-box-containing protein